MEKEVQGKRNNCLISCKSGGKPIFAHKKHYQNSQKSVISFSHGTVCKHIYIYIYIYKD